MRRGGWYLLAALLAALILAGCGGGASDAWPDEGLPPMPGDNDPPRLQAVAKVGEPAAADWSEAGVTVRRGDQLWVRCLIDRPDGAPLADTASIGINLPGDSPVTPGDDEIRVLIQSGMMYGDEVALTVAEPVTFVPALASAALYESDPGNPMLWQPVPQPTVTAGVVMGPQQRLIADIGLSDLPPSWPRPRWLLMLVNCE